MHFKKKQFKKDRNPQGLFLAPTSALWRKTIFFFLFIALCGSAELHIQQMLDAMHTKYGEQGLTQLSHWRKLLDDNRTKNNSEKLREINNYFNKTLLFEDDQIIWKKSDFWATPLDSMGRGAGDCEDYSIAKYLSLLELGVPNQQLRLIYVKAKIENSNEPYQAHMVLGYYETPNATPLILDNLIPEIKSADLRNDLLPIFSFNSQGLWIGNQNRQDPTARLSRWRDLLERAKQDGFEIN